MPLKQTIGSRAQVMHGNATKTSGGLTKSQLKYNKQGKIVSKKASALAKKNNRLVKAGYKTHKGVFGISGKMRGGVVGQIMYMNGTSYNINTSNTGITIYDKGDHHKVDGSKISDLKDTLRLMKQSKNGLSIFADNNEEEIKDDEIINPNQIYFALPKNQPDTKTINIQGELGLRNKYPSIYGLGLYHSWLPFKSIIFKKIYSPSGLELYYIITFIIELSKFIRPIKKTLAPFNTIYSTHNSINKLKEKVESNNNSFRVSSNNNEPGLVREDTNNINTLKLRFKCDTLYINRTNDNKRYNEFFFVKRGYRL